MALKVIQQLNQDLSRALKKRQEVEVLTLRGIKAAIINAEIAKRPAELTEADVIKTLRTEIKKRQEAIELYRQGGRDDLVQKESGEIQIIEKYLPQELNVEELKKIVQQVVAKVGAAGPGDFGKVMGAVMKAVAGRVDGGRVSAIVKEALSGR